MNILVISPHPDDESIGCGGTICKHVANGDNVSVIILTSGEKGGHGKSEQETITLRESEASKAATILKLSSIDFWRQPDGNFKSTDQNQDKLLSVIESLQPEIIYTTHNNEQHPDHVEAALLVAQTVKKIKGKKPRILCYEVWTPIQQMCHIEDISEFVELKKAAIQAYKSQCEVLQFDEAILGLNRYRGEMHCWPGGKYAEVFADLL